MDIGNLFIPMWYANVFFEVKDDNRLEELSNRYKSLRIWSKPKLGFDNVHYDTGWIVYFKQLKHETLVQLESDMNPLDMKVEMTATERLFGNKESRI